jgi:putative hydrolases of HD superfamily
MDTLSHLLALCDQIMVLKQLPRTGWLQRNVPLPESVAEHSFGVAALALVSAAAFPELDRGRLLALALIHDMGEAQLTELPLTAQRLLGKEANQAAERRAATNMFERLPGGIELVSLWEECAAGASREARLVKALDRIELLAQALAYERAGNRMMAEFWRGWEQGWDEFPLLAELAAALARQRGSAL